MKDLAKKRGDRAAKLFTKISDDEFEALLAAITREEAHRTNAAKFPRGGRDEFYRLCWKAMVAPPIAIEDWEISAFIDDLWNATMGSHRLQEYKPCW